VDEPVPDVPSAESTGADGPAQPSTAEAPAEELVDDTNEREAATESQSRPSDDTSSEEAAGPDRV